MARIEHALSSEKGRSLALRLAGVRRRFEGGILAVDGVDLEVQDGEFVALLGPSGCGKSTLLRLIAGLDRADEGEVFVPIASQGVAYVFQDAHLLPWRTVLANVALPLELKGAPLAARDEAARAALDLVGLSEFARRRPMELSGGMRMRASLARALVASPKLLLLDEPFAALDELTRQRLDDELRSLWDKLGVTVIFVTHAIAEAAYLAERAVVFSARPAKVVLDHPIDLPRARSTLTRSEPAFGRATRALYEALAGGER